MNSTKFITERFADISALQKKLSSESGGYIFRGMASSNWRIQTSIDSLLCRTRQNNNNPLLPKQIRILLLNLLHNQNLYRTNHSN